MVVGGGGKMVVGYMEAMVQKCCCKVRSLLSGVLTPFRMNVQEDLQHYGFVLGFVQFMYC
jgi:hypothetical protein